MSIYFMYTRDNNIPVCARPMCIGVGYRVRFFCVITSDPVDRPTVFIIYEYIYTYTYYVIITTKFSTLDACSYMYFLSLVNDLYRKMQRVRI